MRYENQIWGSRCEKHSQKPWYEKWNQGIMSQGVKSKTESWGANSKVENGGANNKVESWGTKNIGVKKQGKKILKWKTKPRWGRKNKL